MDVLIVDDNPANLRLAAFVLGAAGHQVRTSADAAGALLETRNRVPEIALLDIGLPGMDGLRLARQFRSAPVTAGMTLVALTAFAMKGDREKALAAGFDGFIAKPVNTRTLAEEILLVHASRGAVAGGRAP